MGKVGRARCGPAVGGASRRSFYKALFDQTETGKKLEETSLGERISEVTRVGELLSCGSSREWEKVPEVRQRKITEVIGGWMETRPTLRPSLQLPSVRWCPCQLSLCANPEIRQTEGFSHFTNA